MIEIKSINQNNKYISSIDRVKYLLGPDRTGKEYFVDSIKRVFYKIDHSEYAYENKLDSTVTIDEKTIKLKNWKLLDIHTHINLNQELAIGSRSMMHQYIESILRDIEYSEELNTINILFEQLAEMLFEKMIIFDDIEIDPKFETITQKQLIKMLSLRFINEKNIMDYLDLSYEAKILFQIYMAKQIVEKNELFKHMVIIDIPRVSEKIKNALDSITSDNMFVIVLTEANIDVSIKDVTYFGTKVIDFSNDISIYNELMMEIDQVYNLDEMKCVIKRFIEGIDDKDTRRLENYL